MKFNKLLWIFVLALLVRIFMLGMHDTIEIDGVYYATIGKNLVEGNGYIDIEGNVNTVFTPLYPILIGVSNLILNNLELSARIIAAIFGALLVFPVYLLAKRFYNKRTALISAIIISIYPALTYISTITYSDALYLFLVYNMAYFGYMALEENKTKFYALTGLFIGLSYLTRPEAAAYAGILTLLIFFWSKNNMKSKIKNVMILLLVFLIIISPYLGFVYSQTESLSLSGKGYVIYKFREYVPFTQEYEKNIFSLNEAKDDITLNPYTTNGSLFNEIMNNLPVFLNRYFSGLFREIYLIIPFLFPFVVLSLISFIRKWNRKELKKELYLFAIIAYPILFYPIFWVESRYMLSILPILIIWASKGILKIEKRFDSKKITTLIIAIIFAFSFIGNVFANDLVDKRFEKQDPPIEHKEAGLWLKEKYPNSLVIERKPWVSFYSDSKFAYIPYSDFNSLLDYACNKKADFIVIDQRYTEELRPELNTLLKNIPDGLDKVYEDNSTKEIRIYNVKC